MSANRDVVLVAAKAGDVALHPSQHGLLVQSAVIGKIMALRIQCGMREKAEKAEAIIDGDDDGVALRRQFAPIVAVACAVEIAAAVDPDDHRKLCSAINLRGVDIQVQTIFIGVWRPGKRAERRDLQALRTKGLRL